MDSLHTRDAVRLGDRRWRLHRLDRLGVDHLPFTLKVLLENLLRHEDGQQVTVEQVEAVRRWDPTAGRRDEVDLHPTRVFLHDTNGVPSCSASVPSSPSPSNASTAPTSSAWASCPCSSSQASRPVPRPDR